MIECELCDKVLKNEIYLVDHYIPILSVRITLYINAIYLATPVHSTCNNWFDNHSFLHSALFNLTYLTAIYECLDLLNRNIGIHCLQFFVSDVSTAMLQPFLMYLLDDIIETLKSSITQSKKSIGTILCPGILISLTF